MQVQPLPKLVQQKGHICIKHSQTEATLTRGCKSLSEQSVIYIAKESHESLHRFNIQLRELRVLQ